MDKSEDIKKQIPGKKAEMYVRIVVSSYEAALIKKLRMYEFGTFNVYKSGGEPRRCETLGSEILKESDGLALAIESKDFELENQDKIVNNEENMEGNT